MKWKWRIGPWLSHLLFHLLVADFIEPCSYFKGCFYMPVVKKNPHKPKQKTPLLLCSQSKVCPCCCSVFGAHLNWFTHSLGKWKIQKIPGPAPCFPFPSCSCGRGDAGPGSTEVIAPLGGESWGRKPGLQRAKKVLVPIPPWGTAWLPVVLFLLGHWFQLGSVQLDPPREFLVDIQVLAEQIDTNRR